MKYLLDEITTRQYEIDGEELIKEFQNEFDEFCIREGFLPMDAEKEFVREAIFEIGLCDIFVYPAIAKLLNEDYDVGLRDK
jgi:hypothetical protein